MFSMKQKLLAIAICSSLGSLPTMADIKIGVLVPDSGPAGLFGPSTRNSAMLAAEEINASGGINGENIELIFADVGVPPAAAVQSTMKLWKGEGVQALVGMNDSAVREAILGRIKGKIPYIYTPVYEGNACAPGLYSTGETPSQQLAPVIPYLQQQHKVSKWYLIGHDYNWPRETNALAKQYIKSAGGELVGEEYVPFTVAEFDSSLQRIKASGADGVLITLVGGGSVSFNIAYASFGLDQQAIRLGTLIEENTLAGIGAANSKGLYSTAGYFKDLNTPAASAFKLRYEQKFGTDSATLNTLGQSSYQGLKLLATLANAAGNLSVAGIDMIAEGTNFASPRGEGTVMGRHVNQSIYLADGTSGQFKVVQSFANVTSTEVCAE